MTRRIAFLGSNSLASFENLKHWSVGKAHQAAFAAEDKPDHVDVFGVGRQDVLRTAVPAGPDGLEFLAPGQPIWMNFPPQFYDRVAISDKIAAVACSGRAGADAKVVIDSLKAGKAVFVESLEHFDDATMKLVVELVRNGALLMTGLYQRFDAQMYQASQAGIENMVGKPLLYQAHASTLDDSLYDLGMQHVDAVRLLLKSEPVEVFATGSSKEISGCDVLALTLKLATGVVATIALDRTGTSAIERVLVVGDQARAEFEGDLLERPALTARVLRLQKAGVNQFLQVVLEGASPRMSIDDILRARAIMMAATESLSTGKPAAVEAAAAGAAEGLISAAPSSWAGKVASKVAELAVKATGKAGPGSVEDAAVQQQQADTPPRSATKAAHIGTRTPDSPELLQCPSGDSDRE